MHPLGLLLLGTVALFGYFWLRSQPRRQQRAATVKLMMVLVILVLIYLAITGKLHWLGALVAALLPFVRKLLPLLLRLLPFAQVLRSQHQQSHRSSGNTSEVNSRLLKMVLDHDSGVMYGTVLGGPMQGRELGDLDEQEFIQLLQYCRHEDAESARLLEAYLDKRFGDRWRQDDPGPAGSQGAQQAASGPMNREEALQILGLADNPTEQQIIEAHRRLMQRLHPDRGGSDYLAAKINQAKDLLLKT